MKITKEKSRSFPRTNEKSRSSPEINKILIETDNFRISHEKLPLKCDISLLVDIFPIFSNIFYIIDNKLHLRGFKTVSIKEQTSKFSYLLIHVASNLREFNTKFSIWYKLTSFKRNSILLLCWFR